MAWWSWLAGSVHWFNPAIYWVLARVRRDREMACDEWVLGLVPDARAYGAALVRFTELNPSSGLLSPAGGVGIFECKSALFQRVRRIAAYRRPTFSGSVLGGAILATLALLTLTNARDSQPPGQSPANAASTVGIDGEWAQILNALQALEPPGIQGKPADVWESVVLSARKFHRFPTMRFTPQGEGNVQLTEPTYQFTLQDSREISNRRVTASWLTLLTEEISQGNPSLVRRLLAEGASPNLPDNDDSQSLFAPLESAIAFLVQSPLDTRRREIVKILLDHGAEGNPKRGNHRSLLFAPVSRNLVDVVTFLLESGIDPRNDADGGAGISQEAELHGTSAMKELIEKALSKSPDPYGASKLRDAAIPKR